LHLAELTARSRQGDDARVAELTERLQDPAWREALPNAAYEARVASAQLYMEGWSSDYRAAMAAMTEAVRLAPNPIARLRHLYRTAGLAVDWGMLSAARQALAEAQELVRGGLGAYRATVALAQGMVA